ncbi:MAG TPA: hypothetical protein DCM87_17750 [Planctomycetes bacterium]|jgi:hypothetical protein|nr:hypothetical protein [Planctomycetota bacterium]
MASEFKVLEWLRSLRDAHARETEGLSPEERIEALRSETEAWTASFLADHPDARSVSAASGTSRGVFPRSHGND